MKTELPFPNPPEALAYFRDKMTFTTGPVELERYINAHANLNVIDVRYEEDYAKGHIPHAVNLPPDKWPTLEGLAKDKTNVLYCYSQVCHLAAAAAVEFASQGFPVMELEGGFAAWKQHGLEIEHAEPGRVLSVKQ